MSKLRTTPRMILATLALPALLLSASCSLIPKTPIALSCLSMIPDDYKKPVQGAPLPVTNKAGDWVGFGIQQTNNLDVANDHQTDTLTIVGQCDKLNAH